MSHRRPDPRQAILEQTLRRALRRAADSVEPAADGLDRIRAKIAAGPTAPVQASGWAGWASRAGWRTRYLTGLLAALAVMARYLEPAWIRVRYAYGAVAERFKPDQRAGGWIGWLRPLPRWPPACSWSPVPLGRSPGCRRYIYLASNSGQPATAGSGEQLVIVEGNRATAPRRQRLARRRLLRQRFAAGLAQLQGRHRVEQPRQGARHRRARPVRTPTGSPTIEPVAVAVAVHELEQRFAVADRHPDGPRRPPAHQRPDSGVRSAQRRPGVAGQPGAPDLEPANGPVAQSVAQRLSLRLRRQTAAQAHRPQPLSTSAAATAPPWSP